MFLCVVVGADGTVVSTECKYGIIQHLESKLRHAAHWSICLLHFDELPLRYLFETLDGVTSGSKFFSGPIGKLIQTAIHLHRGVALKAVDQAKTSRT